LDSQVVDITAQIKSVTANMWQILGFVAMAVSGVLLERMRRWYINWDVKKPFYNIQKLTETSQKVRELLIEAMAGAAADRAELYQFKNGEYFISGESSQKLCLTHCAVKNGISAPQDIRDLPIGFISNFLSKVLKDNPCVIHTELMETSDHFIKQIFTTNANAVSYAFVIKSPNNQMLGVVMLVWISDEAFKKEDIDASVIQDIVSRVGSLLSIKKEHICKC